VSAEQNRGPLSLAEKDSLLAVLPALSLARQKWIALWDDDFLKLFSVNVQKLGLCYYLVVWSIKLFEFVSAKLSRLLSISISIQKYVVFI
jgi:hypothetical protein